MGVDNRLGFLRLARCRENVFSQDSRSLTCRCVQAIGKTLVEELGKLTVVEAGELAKKLEKTWGIDLAAIQGSAPAPVQEKEDSLFKVTLTGFDAGKKIGVIKAVRAFKDMGLLEAKNFVEGVPSVIAEDQQKEEADKIKKDIETAGGKIEVK